MNKQNDTVEYLLKFAQNITVLYAEDEPKHQQAMLRYLSRYFKNIDTVSNGQEALQKFNSTKEYDLIITDINMPIMSGMKFIEEVKKNNKDQEVIIVSAFSEQDKLMQAISLGVNGYILKPTDFDVLNTALYNSVSKLKTIRENKNFQNNLITMVEEKASKVKALSQEKVSNMQESVFALVDLIEKRDTYTAGHSGRVAQYSLMIADALHCSLEEISLLGQAAMLHDLGKVTTPDAILLKPYSLDPSEYKLIQEHVQVGYDLLSKISMYAKHAQIIYAHHEHYDGTGYPRGLKGSEIPKLSRIMTIADSFDAMTTQRIYQQRKNLGEAINKLKANAGKQFDPEIVEVACKVLQEITLPRHIGQFPKNSMEQIRYAYYFKDTLCHHLFNDSYFEFMMKQKIVIDESYDTIVAFKVNKLEEYNKVHSWKSGNNVLKGIGEHLHDFSDSYSYFRIRGDLFVTLMPSSEIQDYIEYLYGYSKELKKLNVTTEIAKSNFDINTFTELNDISDLKRATA